MHKYRLKNYRPKKRKSILKNRYFWYGISAAVIVCFVLYVFLFSSLVQVQTIQISGTGRIQSSSINSFIENKINKNILFFDTRSIFCVNLGGLKNELLATFPGVNSVTLRRKLLSEIIIQVDERVPAANWCEGEVCYLIDKNGIGFEVAKDESLPVLTPEALTADLKLGSLFVEKNIVDGVVEIFGSLKENEKLSVLKFLLSADRKKLTASLANGSEIYLDPLKSISDQSFNLNLVLKEKIPQEKVEDLEYIDLRFGNKVYIKFRETDQPASLVDLENKN